MQKRALKFARFSEARMYDAGLCCSETKATADVTWPLAHRWLNTRWCLPHKMRLKYVGRFSRTEKQNRKESITRGSGWYRASVTFQTLAGAGLVACAGVKQYHPSCRTRQSTHGAFFYDPLRCPCMSNATINYRCALGLWRYCFLSSFFFVSSFFALLYARSSFLPSTTLASSFLDK